MNPSADRDDRWRAKVTVSMPGRSSSELMHIEAGPA